MQNFLILKTFHVQWINHPIHGLKTQMFAEDMLYEDVTNDLESFAVAEDLSYGEAMLHCREDMQCIITRTRDLRVPVR
jgi:hypothetical protein